MKATYLALLLLFLSLLGCNADISHKEIIPSPTAISETSTPLVATESSSMGVGQVTSFSQLRSRMPEEDFEEWIRI